MPECCKMALLQCSFHKFSTGVCPQTSLKRLPPLAVGFLGPKKNSIFPQIPLENEANILSLGLYLGVRWFKKLNIFRFHRIKLLDLNVYIITWKKKWESVERFNMYIIEGKFYHLTIFYSRVPWRLYKRILNWEIPMKKCYFGKIQILFSSHIHSDFVSDQSGRSD